MKKRLLIGVLSVGLLVGCAVPTWVGIVEGYINVALPIAAGIVSVVDPAIAPIASTVVAGIASLEKIVDAIKKNPNATTIEQVQAAFDAVNQDIAALESTAQIKNAGSQAEVTALVGLLDQAVDSLAAQVNQLSQNKVQLKRRTATPVVSADELKAQYNKLASSDPRLKPIQ